MAGRTVSNHFGVTGKWLFYWLMVTNATSMLLFGYDQGVFGGILTLTIFEQRFGLEGKETVKGVVVGSYDLGCLVGALATGPIGGNIGRKRSILLGTTLMIIGAFLQFLASDFGVMTAGRVISGIGNGMNTATAPVWASETSKTADRGKTGVVLMIVNIGGLAISCWITYAFSFITTEMSWRFPLAFQLFFALTIYLTAFWLPESPRWLILRHKHEKAKSEMLALEGQESTAVIRDFENIKRAIDHEQTLEAKAGTKPGFRLILGIGCQAMQQLTGINVISYYLPYVLTESVGLSGPTARLLAAVNSMTYLASTFIGLFFIEKWGRRNLMMWGATGQCCCWLTITVLLSFASETAPQKAKSLGIAATLFFFLFNLFFGAGWQGVSWLYPTEINSTKYRITGMSYGVATNWLINFAVVFITPLGIAKLKAQFYVIWTVFNAFMVIIVYVFYPETAGRSLEDIDTMFEHNPTIWAFSQPSMTTRKPATGPRPTTDGTPDEDGYTQELDEVHTHFHNDQNTPAEISNGTGPFKVSISSIPRVASTGALPESFTASVRHRQAHPGNPVPGSLSLTPENKDGTQGSDMTQVPGVLSSQTSPSLLGPQTSTKPLIDHKW